MTAAAPTLNGTNGHANGHSPSPEEIARLCAEARDQRRPGQKVADARPATPRAEEDDEDLGPCEAAILEVATMEPQTTGALARLAGYTAGTATKAITSLCRKGLLNRRPDGYAKSEHMEPMEEALLAVATATPQSPKTLARLAGMTMGSHISRALTALCRKRLMVRLPEGYILTDAVPPAALESIDLTGLARQLRAFREVLAELEDLREMFAGPLVSRSRQVPAVEQAVLSVATKDPQTAKAIARLAGYSEGRVREAIAHLTDLDPPLLIRVNGGVRLP